MKAHLVIWLLVLGSAAAAAQPASSPLLRLYLEEPGIYRVSFEELVAAGLDPTPRPSSRVGLESFGKPVPVFVDDGGDGLFGPGDAIEFVGERLRGQYSYLDEFSRFNCYVVRFDATEPARFRPLPAPPAGDSGLASLRSSYHLERDLLMLRFSEQPNKLEESWYWAKLTHLDKEPLEQVLDLRDLAVQGEPAVGDGMVRLTIALRGWSTPRVKNNPEVKDHAVTVLLNGAEVGAEVWDGKDHHRVSLELPCSAFVRGPNRLGLRVPTRQNGAKVPEPLIDVVMLNWIEISYPLAPEIGMAQVSFELDEASAGRDVRLISKSGHPLTVMSASGLRLDPGANPGPKVDFVAPDGAGVFFVSTRAGVRPVDEVVLDRPSRLHATDQQADYIMIVHRRLIDAVQPLAELHRQRGLTVTVVDVQDIFDEFNFGVVNPRAIHDFIAFAYHSWQRPAPRWVLLVGDASWDYKNPLTNDAAYADWTYRPDETTRFVKNSSTPYSDHANLNQRNLIPTWPYGTFQGHAASDTWFTCVDGDDRKPQLAIGRFPVVKPEEVKAIVDKTIAYVSDPEIGPWRRNLLFIANESSSFQRRSDITAEEFLKRGLVPIKVYPRDDVSVSEENTGRIVDALNGGLRVVHFLGHGGRYIWRTGPPDLKLNRDLFTLDHLDRLAPTRRLPVVISLTCYSAPFDHPSADSIGEKFIRLPGRGAIAVIAASWRNSPSPQMGRDLIDELSRPGSTLGEALVRAKLKLSQPMLVQTYNLLGDPAVPVDAPSPLELDLEGSPRGQLTVRCRADLPGFNGQALVEWVGRDLQVVQSEQVPLQTPELEATITAAQVPAGAELLGVRVYLWDPVTRRDALGWAGVPSVTPLPGPGAGATPSPAATPAPGGTPTPTPAPGANAPTEGEP